MWNMFTEPIKLTRPYSIHTMVYILKKHRLCFSSKGYIQDPIRRFIFVENRLSRRDLLLRLLEWIILGRLFSCLRAAKDMCVYVWVYVACFKKRENISPTKDWTGCRPIPPPGTPSKTNAPRYCNYISILLYHRTPSIYTLCFLGHFIMSWWSRFSAIETLLWLRSMSLLLVFYAQYKKEEENSSVNIMMVRKCDSDWTEADNESIKEKKSNFILQNNISDRSIVIWF